MKLIAQFDQPWVVAIATFTVAIATLAVNIAANVVSPANDFANAFPRWISFKTGGLITGILGLLAQPWKLLADPNQYVVNWLVGYSGGLGAIAGVLIVDYWIVRKCKLDLADLYLTEGTYKYASGWNWCAVVATVLGCVAAWIGKVVPALAVVYDYAWFAGLAVAAGSYLVLMTVAAPKSSATSSPPNSL